MLPSRYLEYEVIPLSHIFGKSALPDLVFEIWDWISANLARPLYNR
jgi:hypothetical protein